MKLGNTQTRNLIFALAKKGDLSDMLYCVYHIPKDETDPREIWINLNRLFNVSIMNKWWF